MLTTLLNCIYNLNDYITILIGKQIKISYVRNNVNNTRVNLHCKPNWSPCYWFYRYPKRSRERSQDTSTSLNSITKKYILFHFLLCINIWKYTYKYFGNLQINYWAKIKPMYFIFYSETVHVYNTFLNISFTVPTFKISHYY